MGTSARGSSAFGPWLSKRTLILGVGLLLVVALLPASRAGASTGFQQDAARSGYSHTALRNLTERWSKTFTYPSSYPVVADGRVIVTTFVDSGNFRFPEIEAFDEQTGRLLWSAELPTYGSLGDIAYDDGTVFIATSGTERTDDAVGYVSAYDAATGARKWRTQGFDASVIDAPVNAGGGSVYVEGASTGSAVMAFREDTGALRWSTYFPNGGNATSPTLSGSLVFTSFTGRTDALRTDDGSTAWSRTTHVHGGGGSTDVSAGGRLYERDASLNVLRIFDEASGHVLSEQPIEDPLAPPPAVSPDAWVYVANNRLVARRTGDNTVLWSFAGDGGLISTPLILGDTVYVGSTSGRFYGVDLGTGQSVWNTDFGDPFRRPGIGPSITPGAATDGDTLAVTATNKLVVYGGTPAEPHPIAGSLGSAGAAASPAGLNAASAASSHASETAASAEHPCAAVRTKVAKASSVRATSSVRCAPGRKLIGSYFKRVARSAQTAGGCAQQRSHKGCRVGRFRCFTKYLRAKNSLKGRCRSGRRYIRFAERDFGPR